MPGPFSAESVRPQRLLAGMPGLLSVLGQWPFHLERPGAEVRAGLEILLIPGKIDFRSSAQDPNRARMFLWASGAEAKQQCLDS